MIIVLAKQTNREDVIVKLTRAKFDLGWRRQARDQNERRIQTNRECPARQNNMIMARRTSACHRESFSAAWRCTRIFFGSCFLWMRRRHDDILSAPRTCSGVKNERDSSCHHIFSLQLPKSDESSVFSFSVD